MTRLLMLALVLSCLAANAAAERGYSGDWATTYGDMTLTESSSAVTGTYITEGSVCALAGPAAHFPVSGFAQPVDWAASAVSDFMYLDLILSRDLAPAKAAAELKRLMPFTAKKNSATPYDGVSFRLLPAPGVAL